MKKIVLTVGSALLIAVASTNAQQTDSTRNRDSDRSKQQTETKRSDRNQNQDMDEARRSRNSNDQSPAQRQHEMVIIQASEVPAALRETLQDPKYQGWENAIIYHNTRTGEYLVSPRPHRFTSEGKEIEYGATNFGQRNKGKHEPTPGRETSKMNRDRSSIDGQNDRENRNDANSDGANTYSTNPNQDTTGVNATQSTPLPEETDRNSSSRQSTNAYRNDSTANSSSSTNANSNPSSNSSPTSNRVDDQNMPTEGMVLVEEQEIPSSLKETLRDSDYNGWERGKLYHNAASGEYILIMGGSENGNDEQRAYRFDKNGKVIKDKKMSGRSNE